MENEHQYELRNSRSRSQTPQVLNQTVVDPEETDHHYDLRRRSRERSYTPGEVSSSRRSSSRSLPAGSIKLLEQTMDTIVERSNETIVQNASVSQNETQESTNLKKPERRSERQRVKRQTAANGQSEAKENAVNAKMERKRKSITPKKTFTSDYSSEDTEREDPPSRPGSAYEIYKKAGEWWNVFPKTDYTYSRASQCRYEIAPGVLAMPNMSRRSIHSDGSTHSSISNSQQSLNLEVGENIGGDIADISSIKQENTAMEDNSRLFLQSHTSAFENRSQVYKRTHVEQFTTHRKILYDSNNLSPIVSPDERYGSNTSFISRKYGHSMQADSDTELDEAMTRSTTVNPNWKLRISNTFSRILSTITTIFHGALYLITFGMFQKEESFTSHNYQHYRESKWSRLWKSVDNVLQSVYLLLVKMLFLDSWLLSRLSNVRGRMEGRRNKVLWIVLLPLFLLAGFWCLPRLISSVKSMTRQIQDTVPSFYNKADLRKEQFIVDNARNEELKSIVQILAARVQQLELEGVSQAEHLKNVTRVIEDMKKDDKSVWSEYDKKLTNLEESFREDTNQQNHETISAMKIEFQTLRDNYLQLKSCCDSNGPPLSDEEIEHHVDRVLAGYFGTFPSKEELARVIQSLLQIRESNNIQKESVKVVETVGGDVSFEDIRRIVKEILKIYDADKTGRVDYALESAGGQVISTRCTQRYNVKTRAYKLLGLTLYYESNNPRTVIQGNNLQPGACWAFQDFPGYLLIKLRNFVHVTGFTLEHAPRSILPNGDMRSAPRKFNVWGLKDESDLEPVMFGEYEFLHSEDNLQYFPVQNTSIKTSYEFVELRIHSNHGQLEYTCLYRFRVHGRIL